MNPDAPLIFAYMQKQVFMQSGFYYVIFILHHFLRYTFKMHLWLSGGVRFPNIGPTPHLHPYLCGCSKGTGRTANVKDCLSEPLLLASVISRTPCALYIFNLGIGVFLFSFDFI